MSKSSVCASVVAILSVIPAIVLAQASGAPPSDFEGRWHGIGIEAAPWSRSSAGPDRSAAESRVLAGIVMTAGGFIGLSPFGCAQPRYTVVTVPPEGLFQGALAGRDAADDADRMGFPEGEISTLRVDCPNASFDVHLAGKSTIKVAIDNFIYTFDRGAAKR